MTTSIVDCHSLCLGTDQLFGLWISDGDMVVECWDLVKICDKATWPYLFMEWLHDNISWFKGILYIYYLIPNNPHELGKVPEQKDGMPGPPELLLTQPSASWQQADKKDILPSKRKIKESPNKKELYHEISWI